MTDAASWVTTIQAITLFAEDLADMKTFYQSTFDMSPIYEDADSVVFQVGPTMINILVTSEAVSLIDPVAVATKESGARAQFTIGVDDVDAMVASLSDKGVTFLNGPMNRPWGIRTAMFADPAGHLWELSGEPTGE